MTAAVSLGRLLARIPEGVFRALGLAFFAAVVCWRAFGFWDPRALLRGELAWRPSGFLDPEHQWWPYVVLESIGYLLLVLGYARRSPALERASTWAEILLPPVGGLLPFVFQLTPPSAAATDADRVLLGASIAAILVGDALMALGYAFLGGSFAILVEARPLKDRGPYRFVRHPVYVGTLLVTLGVSLGRRSWANAGLWVLFVAVQATRAVLEERKLVRATPGYAEYRVRTWMFVPFVV